MPAETAIVVGAIIGVFAFFAFMVAYGDMTWRGPDTK